MADAAALAAWQALDAGPVLAVAGGRSDAERSFDDAAALIPGGREAVDPDMPFIVLNAAHLARWRGNAFARLGDASAITELYAALDAGGIVSDRGEASLRCDLANAHQQRGELDEARKQAAEARRLARRASSVRQRQRLRRLSLD